VTSPLVSCTVPTFNRPHKHEGLYRSFCEQTYEPRELVVLDGSAEPSPFFSALDDPRVRYFHEPEPPREGGVTRIGAIRNRLTQLAKGEILQSRDDDDEYSPSYISELVKRLGDSDVAKLVVWRLLHGGDIYLWDQRYIGGPAYAVRGDTVELTDTSDMPPEEASAFCQAWQLGFMWSAVFRRAVALEIPFPEEGTEDVPWMRALVAAGKKIVQVADAPHLALHVVEPNPAHAEGGSPHFPQVKLRAASAKRMMGAGIAQMVELPQGKPVQIEPGKTYNILAAIKNSHSAKSIETRAAHWGVRLTESVDNADPAQFGVAPPPAGYRLVYFVGVGDKAVTLPWQAPKMLRVLGEASHVERAWVGAGSPSSEDDAFVLRVFVGAGAAMSAEDANVTEYDPARYAGKPPPHRCSAASASGIAKQLDPRWKYVSSPKELPVGAVKTYATVQTPTAKKNIPTWTEGGTLFLQCPYTGQLFAFRQVAQIGAGAPPPLPNPVPSAAQLFQQSKQDANTYLLNTAADKTGIPASQISADVAAIQSGDGAKIALAVDDTIFVAAGATGVGLVFDALVAGLVALYNQEPPPCTIPGCEGVVSNSRPCSSMDYTYETQVTENYETGVFLRWKPYAGSFQDVFSDAVVAAWDAQVTAPKACDTLNKGVDLLAWATAYVGTMVLPFVTAWNLAHPPNDNPYVKTYQIVVPMSSQSWDPVTFALQSMGQLGGLPPTANVAIEVSAYLPNGGYLPPGSVNIARGGPAGTPPDGTTGGIVKAPTPAKPSGALAVFGVLAGTAALAAGGVGVYAYATGQGYVEAWKTLLQAASSQTSKSGQFLLDAAPQKAILKASEPREKPQTIRFPVSKFSRQQAEAYLRREGYKSRGLRQEGSWWVAPQYSSPRGRQRTAKVVR
jgi:Glycosyl transferase family 2